MNKFLIFRIIKIIAVFVIVIFCSSCSSENKLPKVPGQDAYWIPVLVYHRINYAPKKADSVYKSLTIEPEWFEKHLQYLRDNGFTSIHFSDLCDFFADNKKLPARPIIISFDDGYADTYSNAFPILEKYGMTATVFVVSKYIGHGLYLSTDQLKKLSDSGIEIGSHTMTHPRLTKIKNAQREIVQSKKDLEDMLGIKINAFAYPYGNSNKNIEQIVQNAGYCAGRLFSTGNGISKDNLFRIPVVRVYANIGLERWKNQLFAH